MDNRKRRKVYVFVCGFCICFYVFIYILSFGNKDFELYHAKKTIAGRPLWKRKGQKKKYILFIPTRQRYNLGTIKATE